MICPKCGHNTDPVDYVPQTDEEKYLEFWGYKKGTPEAKEAWEAKQAMTKRQAPAVISDIEGYISQVDGSWIDSRSKHRSHLKEHRMIEVGNDVPMQQKQAEISRQSQEARKRQIAEITYAKLRY